MSERPRIGVVLSAGGLRGAAHVGVLRQLVRHAIPIDVIVGVSAGAVIAAYYAAVGLDLDDLVADARAFRGRHLLMHSLNLHLVGVSSALSRRSGIIPERLRQLEAAAFDRLHHGIRGLGIACHDVAARRARYFATGADQGARLDEVARASAAIPFLFAPLPVACHPKQSLLLTDGGLSDPVPIAFARRPPLGATHLIVSDCRWLGSPCAPTSDVVWIRPRMASTGTLWAPRHGLLPAVRQGEAAVTADVIARIRMW